METTEHKVLTLTASKGYVLTEKGTHEHYCAGVQLPFDEGTENWEEITVEQYLKECEDKKIEPNEFFTKE